MAIGEVQAFGFDVMPEEDENDGMTAELIAKIGFTYEELCESLAQVMNERDALIEKNVQLELKIAMLEADR